MLTIETSNLGKISKDHGLSDKEIQAYGSKLSGYLKNIKNLGQGFYDVVDDKQMIVDIEKYAKEVDGRFEFIVVLGIGGSALGTICLHQSLKHLFEHELADKKYPRLYVLDNIDPVLIKNIEDVIDYKKTLFVVVSKSGTTPEPISQYLYFKNKVEKQNLKQSDHFVFITDLKKGYLQETAIGNNIKTFSIPENVGGRFSVLTTASLLPAALVGMDIKHLMSGALSERDKFLSSEVDKNLSYRLAVIQYLLAEKGKNITVMFPYSQQLARFADWYRQLLAESVGKKLNCRHEEINVGITPVSSLGVTDQHSQLQLYQEGPNDKLFIFIKIEDMGKDVVITESAPSEFKFLENVSFSKLMSTEKEATEQALTQDDHPNITIKIKNISPESLGGLFMLFEGSIAFLGELYNINAFDQPGVELAKKLTREKLSS